MAQKYDITFESAPVGTVQMEKQGLYYLFSCRCSLPDMGLYRIHVICDDKREDLGICVPMDGFFGMDKKLPRKHLGEGEPVFELVPKDWKPVPVTMETDDSTVENTQEDETHFDERTDSLEPEEEIADEQEDIFIPVSENEPFEYLDKLEHAVMEVKDDQIGIIIRDME